LTPDLAAPSLPFIGLYAVAVRSLEQLGASLERGGLPCVARDGYVLASFPSALGIGGWVFTESPEQLPWRV
jgi:hypothetical protein